MSPYDPDSRFTMSSLTRLEEVGIKVVTALRDNIEYLKRKLGLPAAYSISSMVEQWEDDVLSSQEAPPPMTWRSLLHILSQGMNLKELSQQIGDYFQHGGELYFTCTVTTSMSELYANFSRCQ